MNFVMLNSDDVVIATSSAGGVGYIEAPTYVQCNWRYVRATGEWLPPIDL